MSRLKLEVGKSYRRRDGEIEDIVRYDEGEPYPFVSRNDESFTESGECCDWKQSPQHLIEEVSEREKAMSGLKLDVGKSYRNHLGEIKEIVRCDSLSRYPYVSRTGESFTQSGIIDIGVESVFDLIEEVVDEPRANTSKCNIMAEATEIAERHPSKDARAFAYSVLAFLREASSSDDETQADPVNHPPHYTNHPSGVECIQITEHFNFNRGNAIKYIWRAGEKGDVIEDLRKALFYVKREIDRIESALLAELGHQCD